ncbi:hypothetical protein HJD18_14845 [Thermoleophilia bacterium SCSIO 60948]|nr:hypothetical protein HJD18_14845 [Thermoleophilia bacterium SCSIO 60948]
MGRAPIGKIDRPDEDERARLDRNLDQLMQGLRVALPGVQVLFAFLLILPFQERFEEVTEFQRTTYFLTLLATAAATVLLIAPSARHRVTFRQGDKRWNVLTANRLSLAGFGCLGIAICGAILLISDFLYGGLLAGVVTALLFVAVCALWIVSPLLRRRLSDE